MALKTTVKNKLQYIQYCRQPINIVVDHCTVWYPLYSTVFWLWHNVLTVEVILLYSIWLFISYSMIMVWDSSLTVKLIIKDQQIWQSHLPPKHQRIIQYDTKLIILTFHIMRCILNMTSRKLNDEKLADALSVVNRQLESIREWMKQGNKMGDFGFSTNHTIQYASRQYFITFFVLCSYNFIDLHVLHCGESPSKMPATFVNC